MSACLLVARKRLSLPQENRQFLLGHFPADAAGAIVQPALQQIELAPAGALLLLKDLFEVGLLDGSELRDVHAWDLGVGLFRRAELDLIARARVARGMEIPDLVCSVGAEQSLDLVLKHRDGLRPGMPREIGRASS